MHSKRSARQARDHIEIGVRLQFLLPASSSSPSFPSLPRSPVGTPSLVLSVVKQMPGRSRSVLDMRSQAEGENEGSPPKGAGRLSLKRVWRLREIEKLSPARQKRPLQRSRVAGSSFPFFLFPGARAHRASRVQTAQLAAVRVKKPKKGKRKPVPITITAPQT